MRRAAAVSAVLGVVALTVALELIIRLEPRLLTASELLPPDESLVWWCLPGLIALTSAIALVHQSSRSAIRFRFDDSGLWLDVGRPGAPRVVSVPWGQVTPARSARGRFRIRSAEGAWTVGELPDHVLAEVENARAARRQ